LRLIDVHDNCIIATMENVKYVALSYLWGLAVNLRLTTANYQDLVDRPGSLARYWSSLPRTIQDAVTFVRDIGERYLWCDALCLVQNNAQDVRSGLDVMDYIYERALFTIVGACGHDADAGLPGVLPGSRMCSTGIGDEIIPGVTLGLDIALDLCLRSSAYISRGWTSIIRFQEEMLSRRLVYFVDNKVYFRCWSSIEFEHGDPRSDGKLRRNPIPAYSHILLVNPVRDFAEKVGLYSKRALTYQADALNAMRG
ncbi:Heterokaryon incompatibility protein (HET) domain containing protein, partial [Rhypophila decipiens]